METKTIWFLCLCGVWIWLTIDTGRRLRKIGDTADRIARRYADSDLAD